MDNPTLLRQVLLYHVAVGTWYSAGLEDGATLRTEHGAKLSVGVGEGNSIFSVCKRDGKTPTFALYLQIL
jgi:uncharacterized surface protein with fasciclin (FAS1) repeats